MANAYREFLALIPEQSLEVGDVVSSNEETVTVMLPKGGVIQARGEATVGQRVFVRAGAVEGGAPTLTYVSAEG